ncbi:putative disease resistance protein rga3 [Nicotiana attenuata]|uniref:Disease resistance protein rga3 n=2 Tax=Nicotiana attenuata TaxID=49451 RepID=A0A1J6IPP7_NICAT|nr:putative disease resistance protein rga3 [Nicotiana attenuata]
MAESFLFNIIERVLAKVSSVAVTEISLAWNVKTELRKLQSTLSTIKAVLLDANEQQAKNHEVRDWLEKLRDVVYDVDDVLDDLSTQLLLQIHFQKSLKKKVRKFFSSSNPIIYRFKIGRKVKEIRELLNEIADDRKSFHFTEHTCLNPVENICREQTHSFVRASDIIGRETDQENIVKQLIDARDEENISVIPIVGLGGLGKTTLVKLVYNYNTVVQNFDLRMWVSISEDFSLSKVIEKILRSATGESFGHLDMDQLQGHLSEVLRSKRYLLVLDDVWNEDQNKWTDLRELLMNCSKGSKIVVTTRSKMVALITGTVAPYYLGGLTDDACLLLFLKCAFVGEDKLLPNLVEIGKEIVKKCGGVPLAVKTLGRLLYMKTDENEWLRIRDNEIWEIEQKQSDILPILRLSYEQMPSHLRQCFAYCSMLSKGQEIPREDFINRWIAQGFIQSSNGSRKLEDIGNQYFDELLSRFCFLDVVQAFDGEILACKLHNLVHDLAQSVAGSECLNVKSNASVVSERVRHLFFHAEDMSRKHFPRFLLSLQKLRSFSYSFNIGPVNKFFVKTTLSNFKCLRVLVLNNLDFEELPTSIGHLKELRYLNLSDNGNIKFLPMSMSKLVNLQTFNLINCEQLKELPRDFGKLICLKTLYLTTYKISAGKNQQSFPSLQFLLLFKCCFPKLQPELVQQFTALRVLRIYECPSLCSLPSSIRYLTSLEKLWIWNCEELDLMDGEGMVGLTSLRSLLLMGLPKLVTLPLGLKDAAHATLKYFRVADCPNLVVLPEWLQNCSSLQRLYIEDCPVLATIPQGIYNHNANVHIIDCPLLSGGC